MNPDQSFIRNHDILICIDSDGCVMDTMNIKHQQCFGPCLTEIWDFGSNKADVLTYWNQVNLYSMSRGVNRFQALLIVLKMVDETYRRVDGLKDLADWIETSPELSEPALRKRLAQQENEMLRQVLLWSEAVNQQISKLPSDQLLPFPGVREAIASIGSHADIVVVSSANYEAVCEEWERYGILPFMNLVMAQNSGSKAACIRKMLGFGYRPEQVLMIGDAPGDLAAAKKNGVLFYPIITSREQESWAGITEAVERMIAGTYQGSYQEQKEAALIHSLQ